MTLNDVGVKIERKGENPSLPLVYGRKVNNLAVEVVEGQVQ